MISTSDKPSFSSDVDLIGPPARDNRDTPLLDAAPFESLDENHIALEIISGSIFTGFLAAAAIAGLITLFFFGGVNWIWFGAAGVSIVLVLGSGILAVIWPPIEYRHISWRLDEASLEIHRGVFWKHQISIPLGRVQHADVSQGPLQRYFRMGSLTVHTAGTNLPSIQLDGLPHQTALLLRDRLVLQSQLEDVT